MDVAHILPTRWILGDSRTQAFLPPIAGEAATDVTMRAAETASLTSPSGTGGRHSSLERL